MLDEPMIDTRPLQLFCELLGMYAMLSNWARSHRSDLTLLVKSPHGFPCQRRLMQGQIAGLYIVCGVLIDQFTSDEVGEALKKTLNDTAAKARVMDFKNMETKEGRDSSQRGL